MIWILTGMSSNSMISFARTSLLSLQETGTLTALQPHTSARENLGGYLILVVEHGSGVVEVSRHQYEMHPGDVAFIDCSKAYSHSTSDNLWTISWAHFNGPSMSFIYSKFQERSGRKAVFTTHTPYVYLSLLRDLYTTASGDSYTRDMAINTILSGLLEHVMTDCWSGEVEKQRSGSSVVNLDDIKRYLDEHYDQQITLEKLSKRFFVEKTYLSRAFKSAFGINLFDYLNIVRINKVKELLRFGTSTPVIQVDTAGVEKNEAGAEPCGEVEKSGTRRDLKLAEIAVLTGFSSESYLSMRFKKMEGCSPKEYRLKWK